jgi:hypothetical protein
VITLGPFARTARGCHGRLFRRGDPGRPDDGEQPAPARRQGIVIETNVRTEGGRLAAMTSLAPPVLAGPAGT